MHSSVSGLVIREVGYRDSDKMLTILTGKQGKISAVCRGAKKQKSTLRAGTQFLSYSDFTFYESNGHFTVDSAEPVELFWELRKDMDMLALASYFAEVMDLFSEEGNPAESLLRTGLNCLYALSRAKKPAYLIKSAFEMRIVSISGYTPNLSECCVCGEKHPVSPVIDYANGTLYCSGCSITNKTGTQIHISDGILTALRYILQAEDKKLLSFSLDGDSANSLSYVTEKYLTHHADRNLYTLDFYKSVTQL